jgi:hypothetical protein
MGFLHRYSTACAFLPLLGYERLGNQIFIADDIRPEDIEPLQQMVTSALERIRHVYGEPHSRPPIFITSSLKTANRWGANETAAMHRLPCACIIIGPQGQNVDVIAHEWLHAEIYQRIGAWRFLVEVPIWFDEGAGLTVDYREPFLPKNIDLPKEEINAVQQLKRGKDFFSGDTMQHYQAARIAVIPYIQSESFFRDLDRIANGEEFDKVF